MNWHYGECVPTSLLDKEVWEKLKVKWGKQGFNFAWGQHTFLGIVSCWGYIGVNRHGDVIPYDNPWFYGDDLNPPHNQEYPYILTEQFLQEYLA